MKKLLPIIFVSIIFISCNNRRINEVNFVACTNDPINMTFGKDNSVRVQFPTIFTPDRDGVNDFLTLGFFNLDENLIQSYNLEIYDVTRGRSSIIFQSSDPNLPWDGFGKDDSDPRTGIYELILTIVYDNETVNFVNNVALIQPSWTLIDEEYALTSCETCIFPDQLRPFEGSFDPQTLQPLMDLCE